ncbi:SH3 domain-containing protein [Actinophytocola sediminis]
MKLLKIKWSGKRTLIALVIAVGLYVIYVQGSEQRADGDTQPAPAAAECRISSTVDGLNVRSAPVKDEANVVDQLAQGEESDADKVVENGFRKLGDGRWVSVDFVRTMPGRDCG